MFFSVMAVLFLAAVFFGFAQTYHLHGLIPLLPPALTRWPLWIHGHFQTSLNVTYGVVALAALYDLLSTRRVHPATVGSGVLYVALRNRPLSALLADNKTWWLHLAIHAQNLGHHLY